VVVIGPRGEIWREGVSALACEVAWHGSRQAPPHLQQGSHRVHRVHDSTGQSRAVDEEDQHEFSISISTSSSTSTNMREGETLDAVGSWEGGKRCSINAHECLCMGMSQ
jgi:hypothetical protein